MKVCCTCRELKPPEDFYKSKKYKDGYQYRCKKCCNNLVYSWVKKNPEKRKQIFLKSDRKNKDKRKLYREKNSKEICKRVLGWRKKNPKKCQQYEKVWLLKRPGYGAAKTMKYHTKKLKACPKWVNQEEIRMFYTNCPKGKEVDHIVPLQGNNVSGLHVPWNLQYLTRSENAAKGNKLWGM